MKNRYKICPQLKIYDNISLTYINYLMFVQSPGIRSKVCNTDNYGLRFNFNHNLFPKKTIFEECLEFNKKKSSKEQIIILGGSQVFGVGSTNDMGTISSNLTTLSDEFCFNLGGRAFNGFQEIIQFMLMIKNFKKIKKIIILSGINDLFMYSVKAYSKKHPGPMYNNQFFQDNLKNLKGSLKDQIIRKIKFEKNLPSEDFPEININEVIERNIDITKLLGKSLNVEIEFYLSPYIFWGKKNNLFTDEEKKLINNPQHNHIYDELTKKYNEAYELYKNNCKKNSINFYDLNEMISKISERKEWLFTDRVHMTDLGYQHCARYILKNF